MDPSPDGGAESPPRELIRWGRVFAVLLVFGLVLEATMQTFIYRWSGERYRSLYPYVFSAYGLVRNNPELTSTAFHINPNGFRNLATFTEKKPPHTLRVMILGGSVMYSGVVGGAGMSDVERVDSGSTVAQYLEQDLRADPELAGLDVEVMNAAVSFNRIKEVSAGYIGEWTFWDPDFVIYGASSNNFVYAPPKGAVYARKWLLQEHHGWETELQRIANERSPTALAERGVSTLESFLASVAVARKGVSFTLDTAVASAQIRAAALGITRPPAAVTPEQASFEEYDTYIDEYLGYADAMAAVARRHHQELAFFWEYLLGGLGGIKPMGPAEEQLYRAHRLPSYAVDALYDAHARDAVGRFCGENGVTFLDPIDRLRTYDGQVYIDYLHYTREGNRFVAKFMYDTLRDAIHERARGERARSGER